MLNGELTAVLDAEHCDWFIISANISPTTMTNRSRLGVFLVPSNSDGMSVKAHLRIDGGRAADLTLKNVGVGAEYLLSSVEDGERIILDALDGAIGAWCAEGAGLLIGLLDRTISYIRERKQFGKPISQFQAIRHRVSDMLVLVEHAASLAFEVAKALSQRSPGASALAAQRKSISATRWKPSPETQFNSTAQ